MLALVDLHRSGGDQMPELRLHQMVRAVQLSETAFPSTPEFSRDPRKGVPLGKGHIL
jgi:hypothetical protein